MGKNILLICGSLNQTTMLHKIADQLQEYNCFFTPYYADGLLGAASKLGCLDFTVLGGRHRHSTELYLKQHGLPVDFGGRANGTGRQYEAVFTCSDVLVQKNILGKRTILVQEGMMERAGPLHPLVRQGILPRFLINTAATGLSDAYDIFCVASEGYRDLFIHRGVKANKLRVTGIPNFDHVAAYRNNEFPHHTFILATTACARETFKRDDRVAFIRRAVEIAGGRQLIFKLHPNENLSRARREIERHAPQALIYTDGNVHHMIANCQALVTQYSSVVLVGLAMGKEMYADFDLEPLRKMVPVQNGGTSALRIAEACRQLIHRPRYVARRASGRSQPATRRDANDSV